MEEEKEEEEEEEKDEITTTVQFSTAMQPSCTFAQGNCLFTVNKEEKEKKEKEEVEEEENKKERRDHNYNAMLPSNGAGLYLWAKAIVSLQ